MLPSMFLSFKISPNPTFGDLGLGLDNDPHLLLPGGHELVGAADVVLAQLHQQRGQEPGLAMGGCQDVPVCKQKIHENGISEILMAVLKNKV